jgi:hypothetical protein
MKAKTEIKMQDKDGGIGVSVAVNKDMKLVKQLINAKTEINVQENSEEFGMIMNMNRDIELRQ